MSERPPPDRREDGRIEIPAEKARQAEPILGPRGRVVWIVALALIVLLALLVAVAA